MLFADRDEAGRVLAAEVERIVKPEERPLVLALPHGGLPIAALVAARIGAELDAIVVRKLGAPFRPDFGVGAIAEDGPAYFDEPTLQGLGLTGPDLDDTVRAEREELRRQVREDRGERPVTDPSGRTVVVVDDGVVTGVSARAAIRWLRTRRPRRIVLAVPVCAPQARDGISHDADDVICLHAPLLFRGVSQWYNEFEQVSR